jgi:hypothetical protein
MRRASILLTIAGFVVALLFGGATSASATDPADAPAGYGGPVTTCPGNLIGGWYLYNVNDVTLGSTLQVWYSPATSGTYCAKTFDNLTGTHHIDVTVRRADFTTNWYDHGLAYSEYAGGIYVIGAATKCVFFHGLVTVGSTDYTRSIKLC